jgi:hypothetical protein
VKKNITSPIKLDKNLKDIENRILQKLKNKQAGGNGKMQARMPSIDRNNSPSISYGIKADNQKNSGTKASNYRGKAAKKDRYEESDIDNDSVSGFDRPKKIARAINANRSQSIRQTVGSFRPNDPDSILKSIQMNKSPHENRSEYDLYNSYGSSNGFCSDEKRLSDKMRNKIKATFKLRDEIETADSDSFFSSKFSRFSVPKDSESQGISKPTKGAVFEMMKRQQVEQSKPTNFPQISKHMPGGSSPFSLPSLK